jgi:hypothetical protein
VRGQGVIERNLDAAVTIMKGEAGRGDNLLHFYAGSESELPKTADNEAWF